MCVKSVWQFHRCPFASTTSSERLLECQQDLVTVQLRHTRAVRRKPLFVTEEVNTK
jgi:hypothetical protein